MTRHEAWVEAWRQTDGEPDLVERARLASLIYCELMPQRLLASPREFKA